jgi:hypothetical protein
VTRSTKKMMPEIPLGISLVQDDTEKAFTMRLGDLPNMVDAVFDGHHKMPGWVHMFANAKGCNHVDALFPQACIEWRELPLPGLPCPSAARSDHPGIPGHRDGRLSCLGWSVERLRSCG